MQANIIVPAHRSSTRSAMTLQPPTKTPTRKSFSVPLTRAKMGSRQVHRHPRNSVTIRVLRLLKSKSVFLRRRTTIQANGWELRLLGRTLDRDVILGCWRFGFIYLHRARYRRFARLHFSKRLNIRRIFFVSDPSGNTCHHHHP